MRPVARSAEQVERQRHKDHVALGAAALALSAAVLIWLLWVLPVARSVGEAAPVDIGTEMSVDLAAGERIGIWGSGVSAALGTLDCAVTGPDGETVALRAAPSLTWDDTLWWMTPRPGFEQVAQVVAGAAGVYEVDCVDSLDRYDGEVLVAGDTFMAGEVGLGRTGSNGFAIGSVLAFCAVVLPLFAVLVPPVIAVRRWWERSRG